MVQLIHGIKVVWWGLTSPVPYNHFNNKIIISMNFLVETTIPKKEMYLSLLQKIYLNYYFINKVVICNWWPQTISHGLKAIFIILDFHFKGMWYLRKEASSCEQFGTLSTCLCPKYIKFYFSNLDNSKED